MAAVAVAAVSERKVSAFVPISVGLGHHSGTRGAGHVAPSFSVVPKTGDGGPGPDDFDIFSDEGVAKASATTPKMIFLLSDSTGATLKQAITRALAQFNSCIGEGQKFLNIPQCEDDDDSDNEEISTRAFTYVRSESAVSAIIQKAEEKEAIIVFTIADPVLREQTMRMAELSGVKTVDLFGPLWDRLADFLDTKPSGIPMGPERPRHALSSEYYRRIEAVEYTLKADDGRNPWLLKKADVILVGVSRTGKTPLSVVLSHTMGLKVANVPLVLEVPPPPELLDEEKIDPRRVFCLTLNPNDLRRIRTTRLERRNVKAVEEKRNAAAAAAPSSSGGTERRKSSYADRDYVLRDLKRARDLAVDRNWSTVDVTGRAVEESASLIGEMLNSRFDESVDTIY